MHSDDGSPTFETVDWETYSRSRTIVTTERLLATVGLLAVAALALYNRYYVHVYVFGNWNASTLVEAGIAFMGFHDIQLYSWGATISESINAQIGSRLQTRADRPAYRIWWVSGLPALALTMTLVSFKLLGDGLRDALDPRTEG